MPSLSRELQNRSSVLATTTTNTAAAVLERLHLPRQFCGQDTPVEEAPEAMVTHRATEAGS